MQRAVDACLGESHGLVIASRRQIDGAVIIVHCAAGRRLVERFPMAAALPPKVPGGEDDLAELAAQFGCNTLGDLDIGTNVEVPGASGAAFGRAELQGFAQLRDRHSRLLLDDRQHLLVSHPAVIGTCQVAPETVYRWRVALS